MTGKAETISLIGAGLTGPLLALGLVKRGFHVEVYERRPDMRRVRMTAGRSINLALSTRGIHALNEAQLWDEMRKIAIPMKGRTMHAATSALTFQPYGKDESEVIYSISRGDLNVALMNAAEERGVKICFQRRCTGIDLKTGTLQLRDDRTGEDATTESAVTIACDGSASAIRGEMLKLPRFNFSQQYLDYAYKELTIPAGPGGKHALETNALHIWPRGNYMLIALPNVDGTFACILFLPFDGADSFAQLTAHSGVVEFFKSRFPDAVPLMPDLADNFFANPTGSMVTIKCSPWHVAGRALLLGDAAHAIVPFFGQGINCGFEDCTCLLELLDRHGADWPRVFSEFEDARKPQHGCHRRPGRGEFCRDERSCGRSAISVTKEGRTGAGGQISAAVCAQVRDGYVSSRFRTRLLCAADKCRIACSRSCAIRSSAWKTLTGARPRS